MERLQPTVEVEVGVSFVSFNKKLRILIGKGKSVKINPNIVPILGNIIPEPFAIPTTLKFLFSTLNLDFAPIKLLDILS